MDWGASVMSVYRRRTKAMTKQTRLKRSTQSLYNSIQHLIFTLSLKLLMTLTASVINERTVDQWERGMTAGLANQVWGQSGACWRAVNQAVSFDTHHFDGHTIQGKLIQKHQFWS